MASCRRCFLDVMRKFWGCIFALVSFVLFLGVVALLWEDGLKELIGASMLTTFGILTGVTGLYLFRPVAKWEAAMTCPECQQQGTLSPCTLAQPRPNVFLLLVGGIILTILIHQSQARRFRCAACGKESSQRTAGSWLALAWAVALILMAVSTLFMELEA